MSLTSVVAVVQQQFIRSLSIFCLLPL